MAVHVTAKTNATLWDNVSITTRIQRLSVARRAMHVMYLKLVMDHPVNAQWTSLPLKEPLAKEFSKVVTVMLKIPVTARANVWITSNQLHSCAVPLH